MERKFTVDDLNRAYENRKKKKQEEQTAASTRSLPSTDRGLKQYTIDDLERVHQRMYGHTTETVKPAVYAEPKTPQEIAWDMLMEQNGRKNKPAVEAYDVMNPNSEQMQTFMSYNRAKEGNGKQPTSPWIIKTMDDAAIDEALNILKRKQTDAESRYLNTWNTDKQDDSIPAEINGYKEAIGRYEDEKKKRDAEQQVADSKAYQKKRETAVEKLPEDALALVNKYNQSKESYTNAQMMGAISGNVDQQELLRQEKSMQEAREQLMNVYGISEDEIGKILQYGKELKDEKDTQEMQQQIREDVAEHPIGYGAFYSALDLLMSPATGLAAAAETVNARNYADKDAPINTNASAYAAMNFSNATEQAVNEQIDNPAGQFVYNVGMSTGKSAISAALGGQVTGALGLTGKAASVVGNIVTLPQFGASAYAETLQRDQEKGISKENATRHATAAGIGEMLFEVVSLDKVWEIAGRSGKATAKQVIKDTLVQAGIEGSEEGATDIFDRIADDIINGDLSDYNMSVDSYMEQGYSEDEARELASKDFYTEVVQDVLAGMASGGIMAGGANAVSYHNYTKLGSYVDNNTSLKESVIEAASQMDESTVARQVIEEKGAENISAKDTGTILRSMAEEAQTDVSEVLEKRFEELGESKRKARANAKEILAAVSTPSESVSEEENDARAAKFEQNENLSTVYKETLEGEHTRASDTLRRVSDSYASEKFYQRAQKKRGRTGVTRAIDTNTGENVIVVQMEQVSPKHAMVKMSDGSVRELSEIRIPDNTMQGLYNFAATMEDAKVANAVIEEYAGESLPTYAESCAVFYNAGKLGTTSFDSLIRNPKNTKIVSNANMATLKMMYEMGRNQAKAQEGISKNDKVAPVQHQKEMKQSETKTEKKGEVIDKRTDRADSRIADIAKQVAKRTGLTITLNDELEHGENGHFQKALSRIALSSQSNNEYATLVHELNEFAGSYNQEGMKKVIDTVLDYAQTQEGAAYLNKIVQTYQDGYKSIEADKTYKGAAEEFVFDYLAGVFSSEEGVKDFSRYMTEEGVSQKEQKGILETIADFFKDLADKIMSYLDEHVLSSAAKKGLQADAQKAKEIRKMVLEVWNGAIEDYQGGDVLEDAKYSINVDGEGNQYVNVDTDQHVFDGLNESESRAMAKKVILNEFSGKIIGTKEGKPVVATKRTAKEYAYASKTKDYKNNAKAKMRASTELDNLLEVSKFEGHKDADEKHPEAVGGFDYYRTIFKVGEKYYEGIINVLNTKNVRIFYDMTKLRSLGESVLPTKDSSHASSSKTSIDIIPQKQENTTKKYSIDIDSEDRELSDEQQEYFKESVVRNENGKLLVMYHGTPRGGFTVFKNGLQFFTQNRRYADIYQNPSASSRSSGKEATNPQTYEVYLNIKKPFDIRIPEIREIFINDYVKGGYALGINPYEEYRDTTNTGLPSWEEADNIYEFLEDKDLLDEYDGIIVDEGGIPGENGETISRGISYITFEPNQIKRVDNMNPTENEDIRYSIDIDDSLFDALEETYSAQEQEIASIVEDGFKSLEHVTVDTRMMHRIAYDIKKEYRSAYDIENLTANLTKVFAYLKDHADNAGYEDMVRIVQEIAKPVLEESTDVDAFEKEIYDNFRNYLKGYKIRLNEEQKAEVAHYFGSYENFRKMNFGKVIFSDKGTYLDSLWNEICDNAYQMLDRDISSADEPIALLDAINTLKPSKKNIFGMDTEQAAYDLSLDIFRRFFVEQAEEKANKKVYEKAERLIKRQQEYRKRVKKEYDESLQRLREVENQKREKLAQEYEKKISDLDREMKSIMAYNDAKAYSKAQEQKEKYVKRLAEVQQKANDRILQIKASNRQNLRNKKQMEENRKYRERIKKNASGIISYFNTNTDKKHVPEALKNPVAAFITSLDFESDRTNPESVAQLKWQDSLNELYRRLSSESAAVEGEYEDVYNALIDREKDGKKVSSLLEDMSAFIDSNVGVRISDMNVYQLKELNELITALKRAITTVNQLYVNKRTSNVQELGNSTIEELEEKKDKANYNNKLVKMGDDLLNVSMLDARSYFHRLGEWAESIYTGLRDGFSNRVWLLKEAQDYMEEVLGKTDIRTWTGDNAKVHTVIVQGKELKMTTAQIMSLYELNKRYQAKMHMTGAGIRPADIKVSKKHVELKGKEYGVGKKEIIHRVKPIQLTEYDIERICSELTPEQKRVADAMQKFMAERCADWGNKLTMKMYGYKRFGAKNYFPIKTDGNSVDTRDDTKYWATKNAGFTKSTMENARNAVVVEDIFDVFTKHVTDMATYATFTAPLTDAMKWFNYRQDSEVGTGSVKTEIERAYGAEYLTYFKKLIQDINAETTRGTDSKISDHLVSRVKAASVGANLRVAIQQPTAYVRAAAVMDTKYLIKGLNVVQNMKQHVVEKSRENSAITQWKSWGYFETSIGRSMKGIITGQQSFREKLVEKSMTMAQLGDDITWGALWSACEAEIKDKHPEIAYDTEEYTKLVSERFDEVVDQTQVVDSVLHRSQIMRNTDGAVKMATAFMAEPTKSYNLLMNAVRDAVETKKGTQFRKKAIMHLGRTATAYLLTQAVNAAIVSIIDAMRDLDDDDDDFKTRYKEALIENLKDNANPVSMIPYMKDILSMVEGYDVNRMDMQGLSNFFSGAQQIYKYETDEKYREKHTAYSVFKNFARGASQLLGIPMYNLMRDVESIYHTVTGNYMGGIKRTNSRNYERMVDAWIDENMEEYRETESDLIEKGETALDITNGLLTEIKKRYAENNMTKEEAIDFLTNTVGMDKGAAEEKVKEWKVQEIKKAFAEDGLTQKQVIDRLSEETGMSEEEAEETVSSWGISELREDYLGGKIKEEDALEELAEKYGVESNDAFFKVREWTYTREHPGETCGKFTILQDYIDTAYKSGNMDDRDDIRNEIKTLKAHGIEKKDIVASITRNYKEEFLEAKRNGDYADLQNLLISTYMFAGLSYDEAREKINSWE